MERYQIKNLYSSGDYQGIIALWENEEERGQFSDWDYVYVMNTFYAQKEYDQCLEVYRSFHKKYPDSDKLDDKMAWSCYHARMKNFDFKTGEKEKLKQQAEYIIEHSSQSVYSPKWFMVKYMLKHMKNGDFGQIVTDQDALRYIDAVDPETLSLTCETVMAENGKEIEKASDKETWYMNRAKLLFLNGDYEQCIECSDKALSAFSKYHYNNDSWFRYRKAKSLFALGNKEEARKFVREIQSRGMNHWCLQQLLFEMDSSDGQKDRAMMYAGMCALTDPSHEMRVSFYEDYADYLEANGYQEEADLHRHLVLLIRRENEWTLREKHLSWSIPTGISALNKQETLQKLKRFWTECRDKNVTWHTGSVTRVLAEGRSGFITDENGKSYYFNSRDLKGNRGIAEEGLKVRFTLVDRLDRSKGVIKPNAVQITII